MTQSLSPKPTPQVARRVEELLREVLQERGVNPKNLQPQEIAANMVCQIGDDNSMLYCWKGQPILRVVPEIHAAGTDNKNALPNNTDNNGIQEHSVIWRMFTAEE